MENGKLLITLVECTLVALTLIGWRKTFIKAGYPGWAAFMPFYNFYILVKIAKKPDWWVVLCFVPIVNLIAFIFINLEIARNFGKSSSFGIGLTFLPFLFYLRLGFSDDQFIEETLDVSRKEEDWNKTSLTMLSVDIGILIILAIGWYNIAYNFSNIFQSLGGEIPILTQFALSGIHISFVILALILIAKEFLKNKKLTFIINVAGVILIPAVLTIGVIGLFLPISRIAEMVQ